MPTGIAGVSGRRGCGCAELGILLKGVGLCTVTRIPAVSAGPPGGGHRWRGRRGLRKEVGAWDSRHEQLLVQPSLTVCNGGDVQALDLGKVSSSVG